MARVARLGIVVESQGAVQGATQVKGALDGIGTTAARAQASVTAATQQATRTLQEQTGATRQAAAAQRIGSDEIANAVKRYDAMVASQKAVVQTTKQVTDSTRAMVLAHAEAIRMNEAMAAAQTKVTVAGTGSDAMFNRLRPGMASLAAQALGTNAALGTVGSTLGSLAVGSAATVGVLAGVAAIGLAYEKLTEQGRKQREEQEKQTKALLDFSRAQQQGEAGKIGAEIAAAQKVLEDRQRQRAGGFNPETDGVLATLKVALQGTKEYVKENEALTVAIRRGLEERNRVLVQANNDASSARNRELAALVASNTATRAEIEQATARLRNLQGQLRGTEGAADRLRLIEDITKLQDALDPDRLKRALEAKQIAARQAAFDIDKLREALERQAKAEREVERGKEFKADVTSAIASLDAQIAKRKELATADAKRYLANEEELTQLRFKASLIDQQYEEVERLTDAENRRIAQQRGMNAEQIDEYVRLQREIRNATADTETWAEALQGVVGIAQLIASAFGESGREIAKMGNAAQSLLGGIGAQGSLKGRDGKTKIGLGTALSGSEGAGAFADGLAVVGQYAGAAIALAEAFGLFDDAAQKAREGQIAYTKTLADFAIVQRTTTEQQLRDNISKANEAAKGAFAASGTTGTIAFESLAELETMIAALSTGPSGARKLADELRKLVPVIQSNIEEINRERAVREQRATEDLAVRRLAAAGQNEVAEAERLRLAQIREIAEAEKEFGIDSEYVKALRQVQEAETAAAAAAEELAQAERALRQERQGASFGGNLVARRQSLNGDDRGAFTTRFAVGAAEELAAAEDLLKAGVITQEMFAELARILNDELAVALREMEEAARAAAEAAAAERQAKFDDLAVRELVAKGDENGAARLRRELQNKKELEGVNDIVLMGEIMRVQALEEEAIRLAELAQIEAERARQNDDITRRMIDAYRVLDPAKADELEQIREQIQREELLRNAVDDATRARYEELFALEDQAKALRKLADEQKAAADAAEKLANLTATVEEDWLRATGRGFDADVKALERRRDERIEEAKKAGASEETIRQIREIFNANYQALIASTMQAATPEKSSREMEMEYQTRAVARSISGMEALRLIDIGVSQLTVLRQIAANTSQGGAGNGVSVEVTVQGGNYTQSPESVGSSIGDVVAASVDESLGRRVGVDRRLAGIDLL